MQILISQRDIEGGNFPGGSSFYASSTWGKRCVAALSAKTGLQLPPTWGSRFVLKCLTSTNPFAAKVLTTETSVQQQEKLTQKLIKNTLEDSIDLLAQVRKDLASEGLMLSPVTSRVVNCLSLIRKFQFSTESVSNENIGDLKIIVNLINQIAAETLMINSHFSALGSGLTTYVKDLRNVIVQYELRARFFP